MTKTTDDATLIVPRRDRPYEPYECIGRARLRERGWKPSEIRKYLGDPDAELPGYPRPRTAHLWSKERIAAAESGDTPLGARIRHLAEEQAARRAARNAEIARQREEAAEAQRVLDAEIAAQEEEDARMRAAELLELQEAFRSAVRADLLMNTDPMPQHEHKAFWPLADEFGAAYMSASSDVRTRVMENAIDAAVRRFIGGEDIPEVTREWVRAQYRDYSAWNDRVVDDADQAWDWAHDEQNTSRPWLPPVSVIREALSHPYDVPEARFVRLKGEWWVLAPSDAVNDDEVLVAKRDGTRVKRNAQHCVPLDVINGRELVLIPCRCIECDKSLKDSANKDFCTSACAQRSANWHMHVLMQLTPQHIRDALKRKTFRNGWEFEALREWVASDLPFLPSTRADTCVVLYALSSSLTPDTTVTEAQQIVDRAIEACQLLHELVRGGYPAPWAAKMAQNKTGLDLPEQAANKVVGSIRAQTSSV